MTLLEARPLSALTKYVPGAWAECNPKTPGLPGCNVYLVHLPWVPGVSIQVSLYGCSTALGTVGCPGREAPAGEGAQEPPKTRPLWDKVQTLEQGLQSSSPPAGPSSPLGPAPWCQLTADSQQSSHSLLPLGLSTCHSHCLQGPSPAISCFSSWAWLKPHIFLGKWPRA